MADGPLEGRVRLATSDDAEAIADLHARSWRSAYRGAYTDQFLDGPTEAERRVFWHKRFAAPEPGFWTILVKDGGGEHLLGFLCLLVDHDPRWGSMINNLHVDPDRKGEGVGRALMREAGRHLLHASPGRPVFLYVLAANSAAQTFYRRLGGRLAETLTQDGPDGGRQEICRFAWPSLTAFLEGIR